MSYKLRADQIRTIDAAKYRFSVNGKPWNNIEEMLQVSYIACMKILFLTIVSAWYL
jgi:hypothetical protein